MKTKDLFRNLATLAMGIASGAMLAGCWIILFGAGIVGLISVLMYIGLVIESK